MARGSKDGATIRIGVVGVGYWGPNLVRNISDSQLFELGGLCDARPAALEAIARRHPDVRCTTSYEELLREDIDAVAVATPVTSHY
jgi:predicted dehydrogenase